MSSKTVVDLSKLMKRFSPMALMRKQEQFAKRVAFETEAYVPEDSGTLKGEEKLSSNYKAGVIEWDQEYAQRVYNLPESSIHKVAGTGKSNPKATSHWFEKAKEERGDAWQQYAEKVMKQ